MENYIMNSSLRKVVLAVTAGFTLSQGGASAETTFTWPEPGTVVTTKPDDTAGKAGKSNSRIAPESLSFYDIDQESVESEGQQSQRIRANISNSESLV